ncbi:tetratricopeptide repeat protein [Pseudaestuariivita sp.]|uniref:tetratricopeptide repeat protein n=1 Tax=Pseudaestuariivita sp. TaxID=2211669 RepID=UPI0040584893
MTYKAWITTAVLALSAGGAYADSLSGSYLAAQQAMARADFQAAANYFDAALARDATNARMLEQAALADLSLGQVTEAAEIARALEAAGLKSQVADLAITADLAATGAYGALGTRVDGNAGLGPLTADLILAWSHLGEGDAESAIMVLDRLAEQAGLEGFANYHKALLLASLGNNAAAHEVFEANDANVSMRTRRGIMARAEVLSQLGRNEDALTLLDVAFGMPLDPGLAAMRVQLEAGETLPFTTIRTPRDGVAEVFFSIAMVLQDEAEDQYTLLYANIAEHIRPELVESTLMIANLLEQLERFDLAIAAYDRVPRSSFAFHIAELGRAEALYDAERADAAVETLKQLAETHGHLSNVHATLGDILRREKEFEAAIAPYDRAIAINAENDEPNWFVYYTRGIVHERTDGWPQAEADFRRALEINPDQPQVLNYLGYSLVEKRIKLDEALGMIETAVEKRPNSGYIVDSLGWVLYRLGRFEEAVHHMERAVELEAVDPVVNDHLGDVYWAVGRELEAQFQWRRALSFITDDTNLEEVQPDRIRRKLEVGLDVVLEEEGAAPLQLADDSG